jgi:hypothetical protein
VLLATKYLCDHSGLSPKKKNESDKIANVKKEK